MVYSLLKFKGLMMTIQKPNAGHFSNERLMTAHLSIFSLCILANFGYYINYAIYEVNRKDWKDEYNNRNPDSLCRFNIVYTSLYAFLYTTNFLMLCLFIYLSVKFSEPLEDYRSDFLLLF